MSPIHYHPPSIIIRIQQGGKRLNREAELYCDHPECNRMNILSEEFGYLYAIATLGEIDQMAQRHDQSHILWVVGVSCGFGMW